MLHGGSLINWISVLYKQLFNHIYIYILSLSLSLSLSLYSYNVHSHIVPYPFIQFCILW